MISETHPAMFATDFRRFRNLRHLRHTCVFAGETRVTVDATGTPMTCDAARRGRVPGGETRDGPSHGCGKPGHTRPHVAARGGRDSHDLSDDQAMTDPQAKSRLSPTALPLDDAAKLLSKAGGQPISVAELEADVAAGAPTNADGTLNLVHYAAWLVREFSRRGD
jgi:hypothetical protein